MSVQTTKIAETFGPISTGVPCVVNGMKTYSSDHVAVYVNGNEADPAVIGVDYTLLVAGDYSGVTVTPLAPLTARATSIVVARKTPLTSDFDVAPSGKLSEPRLVEQLDRALMREQETADTNARALRAPAGEAALAVLPPAAARAGKVLTFDGTGKPVTVAAYTAAAPDLSGALRLSIYVASAATVSQGVQSAVDAAVTLGVPLVADWRSGGYPLGAPVYLPDGLVMWCQPGVVFWKMFNRGPGVSEETACFMSKNYATSFLAKLRLYNLDIRDPDNRRRGSFLMLKCDDLLIVSYTAKKLSSGWCNTISGRKVRIIDPDIDTYDATNWSGNDPQGQVWSDCFHFNCVSDLTLTGYKLRGQDDCIAFTFDPAAWTNMLPLRDTLFRNIFIGSGVCQSKIGRWFNLSIDEGEAGLVSQSLRYENVVVDGMVGFAPDDAEVRGAITVADARPAGCAGVGLVALKNITVIGKSTTTAGFTYFDILGHPTASPSQRNIDRVVVSNFDGSMLPGGAGYLGRVQGVADFYFNGRMKSAAPALAANAFLVMNNTRVQMSGALIEGNATSAANAIVIQNYSTLVLEDVEFSGGPGNAAYAALALLPAAGASLRVRGLTLSNATRSATLTGSHGTTDVTGIREVGIAFPGLPAPITVAPGWAAYTPTVVPSGGALTTYSASGRYRYTSPDCIEVDVLITVTTNGTASGVLNVSLPVAAAGGSWRGAIFGWEDIVSGKALQGGIFPNATTMRVTHSDFTYPAGNGAVLALRGTYSVS